MESGLTGFKGQGLSVFDKKPLGERVGNKNMLNKKIPINPRYAEVKSVINHGKTLKDVQIQPDSLIAKKKGENFGRVAPKMLATFLTASNNEESVFGLLKQNQDKENFDAISTRSDAVQSTITT
jgi:hypothetical protein